MLPAKQPAIFTTVTQVAHGFANLTAVYYNDVSGLWEPAIANIDTNTAQGLVHSAEIDSFKLITSGVINSTGHGLTPRASYYLDPATAGAVTPVRPEFEQFVLTPLDADRIAVNISSGGEASVGGDSILEYLENLPTIVADTWFQILIIPSYCSGRITVATNQATYGPGFIVDFSNATGFCELNVLANADPGRSIKEVAAYQTGGAGTTVGLWVKWGSPVTPVADIKAAIFYSSADGTKPTWNAGLDDGTAVPPGTLRDSQLLSHSRGTFAGRMYYGSSSTVAPQHIDEYTTKGYVEESIGEENIQPPLDTDYTLAAGIYYSVATIPYPEIGQWRDYRIKINVQYPNYNKQTLDYEVRAERTAGNTFQGHLSLIQATAVTGFQAYDRFEMRWILEPTLTIKCLDGGAVVTGANITQINTSDGTSAEGSVAIYPAEYTNSTGSPIYFAANIPENG